MLGKEPDQSPDLIADALGLTNAQIAASSAREALPTKTADDYIESMRQAEARDDPMAKPYKPKSFSLGSTGHKEKRETDTTKRKYLEKDFSTDVRKWIAKNFRKPCAFELKVSDTDSLAFDRLETHQREALLKVKNGPHVGILRNDGIYKTQLPYDGYFLNKCAAWVIIQFNSKDRGNRVFYVLDIEDFCKEEASSDRRSLTAGRAGEIGTRCEL